MGPHETARLGLCLALAAFPAAAAESGKKAFGVITVMANVQPSVVVKYEFKALQRSVTAEDIARGISICLRRRS